MHQSHYFLGIFYAGNWCLAIAKWGLNACDQLADCHAAIRASSPSHKGKAMTTFQVQLWPNGSWNGNPYARVKATTPEEAAERMYGRPLVDRGANFQIRAIVRVLGRTRSTPIVLYEKQ